MSEVVSPIKFTSKFGTCGRVVVAAEREKKAFLYLLIVPVALTKSVGFWLSWLGSLVVLPENGRGYRSSSTRVCCCFKSFISPSPFVRRSFSLFYIARTFIQPSVPVRDRAPSPEVRSDSDTRMAFREWKEHTGSLAFNYFASEGSALKTTHTDRH